MPPPDFLFRWGFVLICRECKYALQETVINYLVNLIPWFVLILKLIVDISQVVNLYFVHDGCFPGNKELRHHPLVGRSSFSGSSWGISISELGFRLMRLQGLRSLRVRRRYFTGRSWFCGRRFVVVVKSILFSIR